MPLPSSRILLWVLLCFSAVSIAQAMSLRGTANPKATAPKHPLLLQVSTRPWLYELTLKYGYNISKLKDIPDTELKNVAAAGYNYMYFMGIWELGQYGLDFDRRSEAIDGYKKVLPSFTMDDVIGTDDDIVSLRSRLNALGILLVVDFVPNHSAVDAPEVNTNPSYYVHVPKGTNPPYDSNFYVQSGIAYGRDPYSGGWKDTLQYNFWDKSFIAFQMDRLMKVASLADGIRCDMSMLMLNDVFEQTWGTNVKSYGYTKPSQEFWSVAISAVKKKYPKTMFMAEEYWSTGPKLQSLGFDYSYDKDLYDNLESNNCDNIRNYVNSGNAGFLHGAHFVENHDEERAATHFAPDSRSFAADVITHTVPGLRFFYWGQTIGRKNKLDVHLRRSQPEGINTYLQSQYNTLLYIMRSDVMRNGNWTYLPMSSSESSWRMMAWKWSDGGDQKRLVVVNYTGDGKSSANVVVPDARSINGNDNIAVMELMSNVTYYRSANEMRTSGLTVVLDPWQVQVFSY